jgi:hypothetical protein
VVGFCDNGDDTSGSTKYGDFSVGLKWLSKYEGLISLWLYKENNKLRD